MTIGTIRQVILLGNRPEEKDILLQHFVAEDCKLTYLSLLDQTVVKWHEHLEQMGEHIYLKLINVAAPFKQKDGTHQRHRFSIKRIPGTLHPLQLHVTLVATHFVLFLSHACQE